MLSFLRAPQLFLLSLIVVSILIGCNTDDDQAVSILPYNPMEHIYGTMWIDNDNEINKWEVVIDPSTGRADTIPGTRVFGGSLNFPLGTKNLNDFTNNRRMYINVWDDLVVQDLETLASTTIELKDEGIDRYVINPQYMRFGQNENELYLIDTDRSVWRINLSATENTVQKTELTLPVEQGAYLSHFFYLATSNSFLYVTNTSAVNGGTVDDVILYDPEQEMIIKSSSITESFGFVQHPDHENVFYFLQVPNDTEGFRLKRLSVSIDEIQVEERSAIDLPIDNLSLYMQTIHTATNSYICRGGSNSFEMPTNTIYSIDLDSGELTQEVDLEIEGLVLKLAGE